MNQASLSTEARRLANLIRTNDPTWETELIAAADCIKQEKEWQLLMLLASRTGQNIGVEGDVTYAAAMFNNGPVYQRSTVLKKQIPAAMTDTAGVTAANLINGHIDGTPTAAANYTLPTGTQISTALGANLAVGDSFECIFTNEATNDAFDITLVAPVSGVTFKFTNVLVEAKSATSKVNWGRLKLVNTGTNTWDAFRVG